MDAPPDEGPGRARRLRRLGLAALEHWDLPVASVAKLAKGWNTTFRVTGTDGAAYVLRVQRQDGPDPDAVRAEAAWLAALRRDTDLLVPEPVPTRSGDLVTVVADPGVPGPRSCVLYRWIDGRFLSAGLTPAHLHQVGALTARLQRHGATMPPLARARVDGVPAGAVELVSELVSPAYGAVARAVLDRARAARDRLGRGPDAYGLIHADLHEENYLFAGGRVGAIDFDDCGYGPFVYDLAVTVSELPDLPRRDALRAALLAGYRTVRPLPPEHEAAIDDFVALRHVQLQLYGLLHRTEPMFADWREDLVAAFDDLRARSATSETSAGHPTTR